jgi:hypothetical protein
MTAPPHFETASTWRNAEAWLTFRPLVPSQTAGLTLRSLRIHVRDHKQRELAIGDRTLEAHYGGFVLSQSQKSATEARRLVVDVSYGRKWRETRLAGHEARMYERGPEPPPDDIDGRSPAVVTWHDGDMFYLIASDELDADDLLRIGLSMYEQG